MRLLFIRHGDPNYVTDSLTEKGQEEAQDLARFLKEYEDITHIYVSPLGRAQETAQATLDMLRRTAPTMEWMEEFAPIVDLNGHEELLEAYPDTERLEDGTLKKRISWDIMPKFVEEHPEYLDPKEWRHSPTAKVSGIAERYDEVVGQFDRLLERHGYKREGLGYRCKTGNDDTIAFFCHFGVTSVFLSHLMNCSPFVLWQGCAFAPTSVTEVFTEEREKGIVCFRASRLGDTTHLKLAGHEASFSARFCETFEKEDERH